MTFVSLSGVKGRTSSARLRQSVSSCPSHYTRWFSQFCLKVAGFCHKFITGFGVARFGEAEASALHLLLNTLSLDGRGQGEGETYPPPPSDSLQGREDYGGWRYNGSHGKRRFFAWLRMTAALGDTPRPPSCGWVKRSHKPTKLTR